ncbi:MAG: ATP-dependent DNA ligase [Desulfobacterales bacterium]|nr:ATP-dependent DNA ligase [Desulfobacterales bacterium]
MKIDIVKMEQINAHLEGGLDCLDESLKEVPFEYKKQLARSFFAINPHEIKTRVTGKKFYVSKKIDGHLQIVVFNGEQIFMIGRGGIVRTNLPCLDKAKSILIDKKISSIIAGTELYVQKESERSRVYDVIAALSDEKSLDTLNLAFFDIIEINGESLKTASYDTIYKKLSEIFPKNGKSHIIETKIAKSKPEIERLYANWVEEEGGEGLVVRGDMPFMYKIKPKHTFDAAIVGYAEGINEHKGKIKSILFAFIREEGIYHVVGKVGNNLSEDQRKDFFDLLSKKHVDSTYIETDNEGIAFHMVSPDIIIEVGCTDILTENTYGKPLLNQLIKFEQSKYSLYHTLPGIRFIYPMVERIRDDKSNTLEDIRFSQITDLVYIKEESITPEILPKSNILFREVYRKIAKDKVMVQKFMIWKTNKENVDSRFPAYVMHYTNFSSQRKDPLQKEIRVSNSEDQLMEITKQFIQSNVKKGWEQVKQ